MRMLFKDTVNCQSVVSPSILQLYINWSENEEPRFPTDSVVRLYLYVHTCMYLHFRLRYWCKVVTTKVIIWMRRRYISCSSFGNRCKIKRKTKKNKTKRKRNKQNNKKTPLSGAILIYKYKRVTDWPSFRQTDRQTNWLTKAVQTNAVQKRWLW